MTGPLRAIVFSDRHRHRAERLAGSIWISAAGEGDVASLWFYCPCGCGSLARITVGHAHKPKQSGPSWRWNGSRTETSLEPSVKNQGAPPCPGWHGWLRNGYWEAC
ncbi:DUF6527 family protein [Sagittula salina]|uniref:Uncharacterized protein n=1 Tax=Sagittula salina TaxID=2820268 RepID=A0A940MRB1_9RHOB|nr:DUF6527 family protein [Sagittula salina]MBP0483954.1 hypothetical protein [Sagittula salina]